MEKNPNNSSEDDNSQKPKKGIERYFQVFVPPPEAMQRPFETPQPERRPVPLIPHEGILLFDRDQEAVKKESNSEKSEAETDSSREEDSEEDESSSKKNKKTPSAPPVKRVFRPIIPGAVIAGEAFPSAENLAKAMAAKEQERRGAQVSETEEGLAKTEALPHADSREQSVPFQQAAESTPPAISHEVPQMPNVPETPAHDSFGDLPSIENYDTVNSGAVEAAPLPSFTELGGSSSQLLTPEDHASAQDVQAQVSASTWRPNIVPPTPNQQAATANQVPHYAYYAPNSPPPSGNTGGNQPPVPSGGNIGGNTGGNIPPFNPNTHSYSGAGGSGPNPNALGAAAGAVVPGAAAAANMLRTKNADPLARLMGVGNWFGNRRTRKKLGGRIDQLQDQSTKSMGEMQTRQNYLERKQQQQAQEMQQFQRRQEEFAKAAASGAKAGNERSGIMPAQRVEGVAGRPVTAPNAMPKQAAETRLAQAAAEQDIRRVKTTWLETDVNSRGEVLSDPRDYGEGFQRERQQEIIRDRLGDSKAAGMVGLLGAQQAGPSGSGGQQQSYGALGSGMTTPGLPQGMPTHIDPQHQLSAENKKSSAVPGPAFWIMLAIIIAAFFAAALV